MESKVQAPAIALMVGGVLAVLMDILFLLLRLLGTGVGTAFAGSGQERLVQLFAGGVGIAMSALGLFIHGFVVFGGLKMKNLQGYTMAMVGAALACLPCFPCCCINIPIGIWALITLMSADVKAAFAS